MLELARCLHCLPATPGKPVTTESGFGHFFGSPSKLFFDVENPKEVSGPRHQLRLIGRSAWHRPDRRGPLRRASGSSETPTAHPLRTCESRCEREWVRPSTLIERCGRRSRRARGGSSRASVRESVSVLSLRRAGRVEGESVLADASRSCSGASRCGLSSLFGAASGMRTHLEGEPETQGSTGFGNRRGNAAPGLDRFSRSNASRTTVSSRKRPTCGRF